MTTRTGHTPQGLSATGPREVEQLRAELTTLHSALQEANDTLHAIRRGEVDALVIRGPHGEEQIHTIKGSEALAEWLFEQTAQAIVVCDAQCRVRRASRAAYELSGVVAGLQPFAEMFDLWFADLTVEMGNMTRFDLQEVVQGRTFEAVDIVFERPDSRHLSLLLSAQPMLLEDGSTGALVSLIDVTARYQARDALRRTHEALMQSRQMEGVGRLAGGIAHEFNNVLTAINGYADLAMSMPDNQQTVHIALSEIRQGGERLAMLTRQLLTYSRKQVMQTRDLDLNDLLRNMDQLFKPALSENIAIHMELSAEPILIRADLQQLRQAILNVVLNARDAMAEGGRLTIETRRDPSTHRARLAISDTGCGMDAEVRSHVFEPFFTTKAFGEAQGLGMPVVQGIVQQHGGSVRILSELGWGTRVEIDLPLREDPAETLRLPKVTARAALPTILLVEDETSVRGLMRRVLEASGYAVLEASDGHAALTVARATPHIDLVVTDVVMPGMGGIELVRQLRAERPDVRALFMSGYSDDVVQRMGAMEMGEPFIEKPFTLDFLRQRIRELLVT